MILVDATRHWEASNWTPEWFRRRYPNKVLKTDDGEITMSAFIDGISQRDGRPGPFLREQQLRAVFPDITDHVLPTPPFALPNWFGDNYLIPQINRRLNAESHIQINFCGRRRFPYLHVDAWGAHAFVTQHYGAKEFVVFPPDHEPFLYRVPKQRFSAIDDLENLDTERFPLFAHAEGTRFVLEQGESLFVPSKWWHTTTVPGASLSTVIQILNAHNWPDLVDYVERHSNSRWVGKLLAGYFGLVGIVKRRQ